MICQDLIDFIREHELEECEVFVELIDGACLDPTIQFSRLLGAAQHTHNGVHFLMITDNDEVSELKPTYAHNPY